MPTEHGGYNPGEPVHQSGEPLETHREADEAIELTRYLNDAKEALADAVCQIEDPVARKKALLEAFEVLRSIDYVVLDVDTDPAMQGPIDDFANEYGVEHGKLSLTHIMQLLENLDAEER